MVKSQIMLSLKLQFHNLKLSLKVNRLSKLLLRKTMFHFMVLVNYQEWMPCTQVS